MKFLEMADNIFKEIAETPKKSLLYRLYHQTARTSGLFYLSYRMKNYAGLELRNVAIFPGGNLPQYLRERNGSKFFIDPSQKNAFRKLWLDNFSFEKDELIRLADNICAHRITSFNLKDFDWGSPVNWHSSPQTGKNWPKKHWSKIDISAKEMGDVKYTWQLNRHQHFYALGRAYWATGDEKYAGEFISQFTDWSNSNPPGIGINWTSSLEASVRLVSWLWSFYFFADSPKFTEDFSRLFLKNIYYAASHIESNLNFSRYCVSNDHFVGEAFALFATGVIFPEFKRSHKWKATGGKILIKELDRQVYDDGVYFMHSPYYQRFFMEYYALFFMLADLNKIELPAGAKEKYSKMILFTHSLANEKGRVPDFGENDGSKLYYLSGANFGDFKPVLDSAAMACFGKPLPHGKPCEEAFWLSGKRYLDKKRKGECLSLEKTSQFPYGGYYLLGNESERLIFRCGRTNSYAHADMLNFVLELNGKQVFLDNGTYLYNSNANWRDYFKGTSAHNTVKIDGLDQMVNRRKFKWLSPNPGKLVKFAKTENGYYIEGEHGGYSRLNDPVFHNRSIAFENNKILLTDKFAGRGKHKIEFFFHLPGCEYEIDKRSKKFIFKIDGRRISITPQNPEIIRLEVKTGSENPVAGWHSPSYGSKERCLTIKYQLEASTPFQSVFVIDII